MNAGTDFHSEFRDHLDWIDVPWNPVLDSGVWPYDPVERVQKFLLTQAKRHQLTALLALLFFGAAVSLQSPQDHTAANSEPFGMSPLIL